MALFLDEHHGVLEIVLSKPSEEESLTEQLQFRKQQTEFLVLLIRLEGMFLHPLFPMAHQDVRCRPVYAIV